MYSCTARATRNFDSDKRNNDSSSLNLRKALKTLRNCPIKSKMKLLSSFLFNNQIKTYSSNRIREQVAIECYDQCRQPEPTTTERHLPLHSARPMVRVHRAPTCDTTLESGRRWCVVRDRVATLWLLLSRLMHGANSSRMALFLTDFYRRNVQHDDESKTKTRIIQNKHVYILKHYIPREYVVIIKTSTTMPNVDHQTVPPQDAVT